MKKTTKQKDVFDLLTKDHNKVRTLFKDLMKGKERAELFNQIKTELDQHMNFEETYLYPQLEEGKARFQTLEAEEEHKVGKAIQAELENETYNTDRWLAKAKVFKEVIEHHADEEEDEFFPKARRILGTEKCKELGEQFLIEKAKMQFSEVPMYRTSEAI